MFSEDVNQNCPSSKEEHQDEPNKKTTVTSANWSRPVRHGIGHQFDVNATGHAEGFPHGFETSAAVRARASGRTVCTPALLDSHLSRK